MDNKELIGNLRDLAIRPWGRIHVSDNRVEIFLFFSDFAGRGFLDFPFDQSFSQIVATGISAGAAVGPRKHIFHFLDARVFLNMEEFCR